MKPHELKIERPRSRWRVKTVLGTLALIATILMARDYAADQVDWIAGFVHGPRKIVEMQDKMDKGFQDSQERDYQLGQRMMVIENHVGNLESQSAEQTKAIKDLSDKIAWMNKTPRQKGLEQDGSDFEKSRNVVMNVDTNYYEP